MVAPGWPGPCREHVPLLLPGHQVRAVGDQAGVVALPGALGGHHQVPSCGQGEHRGVWVVGVYNRVYITQAWDSIVAL